jgi:hypothetical protein
VRLPIAFIAVAAGLSAAAPLPASAEEVDVQLVLTADGSGSIDDDEFRLQRSGYAAAITDERVLNAITSGYRQAIAIAFVEWGAPESQHTIVDWTVIRDAASAKAFADKLLSAPRVAWGYNSISNAIAYSADLIRNSGHTSPRKIIDVSGDGPQMNGQPLEPVRARTVADGITINALVVAAEGGRFPGMSGESLFRHYQLDVIGGPGAFAMTVDGRQRFAHAILNKMIREIAFRTP